MLRGESHSFWVRLLLNGGVPTLVLCEGRVLEQPEQMMLGHVVLCTDMLGCCSDCKSLLERLV